MVASTRGVRYVKHIRSVRWRHVYTDCAYSLISDLVTTVSCKFRLQDTVGLCLHLDWCQSPTWMYHVHFQLEQLISADDININKFIPHRLSVSDAEFLMPVKKKNTLCILQICTDLTNFCPFDTLCGWNIMCFIVWSSPLSFSCKCRKCNVCRSTGSLLQ